MSSRQTHRELQRTWEAVRSQVMAHMPRSEPMPEQCEALVSSTSAAAIGEPYYGPTCDARVQVNRLLGLDAAAGQDQWAAELAEPGKLQQAIAALGDLSLDVEARSAIALLLTDDLDQMATGAAQTELLTRIGWLLRRDRQVQARMRYFWSHMEASAALMRAIG